MIIYIICDVFLHHDQYDAGQQLPGEISVSSFYVVPNQKQKSPYYSAPDDGSRLNHPGTAATAQGFKNPLAGCYFFIFLFLAGVAFPEAVTTDAHCGQKKPVDCCLFCQVFLILFPNNVS